MKIMPWHEQVKVPADWTAEKDIKAFIDRYGDSNDYFGEQLLRVFKSFDRLERAIDRALIYFGLGQPANLAAEFPERLVPLRQHILHKAGSERHRQRLLKALLLCTMAVEEYDRVVPDYDAQEHTWLLELIELGDGIARAWMELENAMLCEHEDYRCRADLPEML